MTTTKTTKTLITDINTEQHCVDQIEKTFHSAEVTIRREKRILVKLRSDLIPAYLSFAKNYQTLTHFTHMSCVDWPEDNEFELVFILWSYEKSIQVIVKTRIDRENPKYMTLKHYWPHIETYEREIHEMYGIEFEGNDRLGEFLLEDWDDIPPMRRDFDTEKYALDNFAFRDQRGDAKDVRETISHRTGETLPGFAKDYSVRKKV